MSADLLRNVVAMLAAGIGIPIMAAVNGGLGRHLGAPAVAALVLFGLAFLITLIVVIAMGDIRRLGAFATTPHLFKLGGLFVAFYVLSITSIGPRIGLGNAIVLVLFGQLVSSTVVDHFGLLGVAQNSVTLSRATGLVLLAAGTVLFAFKPHTT